MFYIYFTPFSFIPQRLGASFSLTPPPAARTWRFPPRTCGPRTPSTRPAAQIRGSHLSNATCLTQVFFKCGEYYSKICRSVTRQNAHKTNATVLDIRQVVPPSQSRSGRLCAFHLTSELRKPHSDKHSSQRPRRTRARIDS